MAASHGLGELVYEGHLQITGVTEFGASLAAAAAGEIPLPPSGVRVDVSFEGTVTGRISGTIRGVDYLYIRADRRIELDVRAAILTDDGAMIAGAIGGVALQSAESTTSLLREHVKLTTAVPAYAWVNELELWGVGEVDLGAGTIHVQAFSLT